ncbi:LEA type 2 family protein [Haliea sp. E1-2-M8]|uniref:LEA type 2 family protein n=1 Tax=Haliea sp. E1-2-M8 TaxID=3064706 RepID=UPI0027241BA5|nr:LEA type 2 family protein [Haliea sp. E1-2-M8]MDO8861848.1 LEA type 2 family protein [Haliea sp. E1-2-M8]
MMLPSARLLVAVTLALLLGGCSSLFQGIEPPKVSVDSVRSVPAEGSGPRFQIVLRIANPNARALDIAGISYGVELLGRELVSGVTNQVPRIAGYTEEQVVIDAGVNLLELLRLLGNLGHSSGDALDYRFKAKIDFRGLLPTQYVEDSGSVALNASPTTTGRRSAE